MANFPLLFTDTVNLYKISLRMTRSAML